MRGARGGRLIRFQSRIFGLPPHVSFAVHCVLSAPPRPKHIVGFVCVIKGVSFKEIGVVLVEISVLREVSVKGVFCLIKLDLSNDF